MNEAFAKAKLAHVAVAPERGDAAERVLTRDDFARAYEEITQWAGYAPTPLVSLEGLARALGVARIEYKDEGPRFGLGSFKALGGSYAALRVLQREIVRRTGEEVALEAIREGRYADACR